MAMNTGVVLVRTGATYRVYTDWGEVTAVLRGKLRRREDDRVVAGDVVELELQRRAADVFQRRFGPAGYQILLTSVQAAEGLPALRDLLRGRASVLTGPSGVGKSSLMNALHPGLNLRIGEISSYWGKGKHTTRAALLVPLAGRGFVVDTPGLREV